MAERDFGWPMYFTKRGVQAKRVTLKKGDAFPFQAKSYIRGLAAAFGVQVSERVPFSALDFVETVDVRTHETAVHVLEKGLTIDQTRKLLAGGADAR